MNELLRNSCQNAAQHSNRSSSVIYTMIAEQQSKCGCVSALLAQQEMSQLQATQIESHSYNTKRNFYKYPSGTKKAKCGALQNNDTSSKMQQGQFSFTNIDLGRDWVPFLQNNNVCTLFNITMYILSTKIFNQLSKWAQFCEVEPFWMLEL